MDTHWRTDHQAYSRLRAINDDRERKDALLRDALEALELSRDNVNECLNEALAHKGYIRWDKRASAYAVQLAQHDKVTEAIKEELKC